MVTVEPSGPAPTSVADSSTESGAVSQDDLVRFLAATETVLVGTPNEGVVYDSPEIYIGIAEAACARFDAGDRFDVVATELVVALASPDPSEDTVLAGAIIGAAVRTICPEHATVIGPS